MSTFAEHDIHAENRIIEAYKGKREHFVVPNIPNKGLPGQTIKILIPKGSSDTVMVRETQQLTFDLELESKDKCRTIVNNVGRRLVAKKTLSLGSTELEVIQDADIFDTYIDLYKAKLEREQLLLQGIQNENGLKARVGAKKTDGTDLTFTSEENALAKTLGKRFQIPLDFDFFKRPCAPYYLHEDLYVTIELQKSEKVMLCTDTNAKYSISDISLEYDGVIDPDYATQLARSYIDSFIPYTAVTAVSYQRLSTKDPSWMLNFALSTKSLQGLLLIFLKDQKDFANEPEKSYNPTLKKVQIVIDGDPLQLYKGGVLPRNQYPEIVKKFGTEVSWGDYVTTKYALWIDTRSSTDNKLHGSGRKVLTGIRLLIDKAAESSGSDLTCHIFAIKDAIAYIRDGRIDGIDY